MRVFCHLLGHRIERGDTATIGIENGMIEITNEAESMIMIEDITKEGKASPIDRPRTIGIIFVRKVALFSLENTLY